MVKKSTPRPDVNNYLDTPTGESLFISDLIRWCDEFEQHHIDETTELVAKLTASRARVDELLQKNNEYLERARVAERQVRAQEITIAMLQDHILDLHESRKEQTREAFSGDVFCSELLGDPEE